MAKVPSKAYLNTTEVAEILGESTDVARRWLLQLAGARKRGGRYYAPTVRVVAAFPEAFPGATVKSSK